MLDLTAWEFMINRSSTRSGPRVFTAIVSPLLDLGHLGVKTKWITVVQF